MQIKNDHATLLSMPLQLQIYTLQSLYVTSLFAKQNLHVSTSPKMKDSCKLSLHKLKVFSNHVFYQNFFIVRWFIRSTGCQVRYDIPDELEMELGGQWSMILL